MGSLKAKSKLVWEVRQRHKYARDLQLQLVDLLPMIYKLLLLSPLTGFARTYLA